MTDNNLLESALAYAKRFSWAVLPVKPRGKEPLTAHGCNDATTDAAAIRRWWERWPGANVAIACGPSKLVVIDLDAGKGGEETWEGLKREHSFDDDTVISITGGGGQHLVFARPNGADIRNSAGKLGEGVDVRGNGGYIVAPPSIHPTGREYVWDANAHPGDRKPAPLPDALRAILVETSAKAAAPLPDVIPDHERNVTLTSLAGSMRRRGASEAGILAALVEENTRCDPPLGLEELEGIAKSMARYQPAAQRQAGGETDGIQEIDPGEIDRLEILMSADELASDNLPATWIDYYLIFAARMVSAPANFHQTIGFALLSAIVGRKVGVELRHGRIFPNLWGLLIAPSTVYHKTGSIRLGRGFLERIDGDLVYPDDATPEAMISDVMTERSSGIIMRDEFAGWLRGAKRDYKSDLKDLYMHLFDCPSKYQRTLRTSGTVTIDNPYLCLMSAAVPVRFYEAVRPEDWTNGFLARFLFALPDADPDWDARPEIATKADKEEQARLTGYLQAVYDYYHNTGTTFLRLGDGVLDRYAKHALETQRRAYEHEYQDLLLPFAGRLCDYVLKLAMLIQVVRGLDESGQFTPPTTIDALSLQRAICYTEDYANDALKLIEQREQVVSGALMQKVFRVIARFGPGGATHSKVLPLTNLKGETFRRVIEKLALVGAIEVKRIKAPGARRAARHYTATTDRLPIRRW